jgi:hypothetical protein
METPLGGDKRILPNGNLMRINKTFNEPSASLGSVGERLLEVDWEGNVVWEHNHPTMHHDFYRFDNGNTLLNIHVRIPPEIVNKVKGGIPGSRPDGEIWGSGFQEITPDGEVVWEWIGHDHLDPDIDVFCPLCPLTIWGYINGVSVFPNGDIVASVRHLNIIMIIDRKTGDIKWRWGSDILGHPHNPTVLQNGNILLFDNGFHRPLAKEYMSSHSMDAYSQVLEVNPTSNEIEWRYQDENKLSFFSAICSSAERLPNGNTLICESTKGRIFEVTPQKEIVWEFFSPFYAHKERLGLTNYIFKAHRYGYEYAGLKGKDLNPNKFEFVLKEKDGVFDTSKKLSAEEEARRRLAALGY